jgi:hypothetical protein
LLNSYFSIMDWLLTHRMLRDSAESAGSRGWSLLPRAHQNQKVDPKPLSVIMKNLKLLYRLELM